MTELRFISITLLIIKFSYGIVGLKLTDKVSLDLSDSGDDFLAEFTSSFTKFLEKYDFSEKELTLNFLYEIIPPRNPIKDIEVKLRDKLIATVTDVASNVKQVNVSTIESAEFQEKLSVVKRIDFDVTLSNVLNPDEDSNNLTFRLSSNFENYYIDEQLPNVIKMLYADAQKSSTNSSRRKIIIFPPKNASEKYIQKIKSAAIKEVGKVVKLPYVAAVDFSNQNASDGSFKKIELDIKISKRTNEEISADMTELVSSTENDIPIGFPIPDLVDNTFHQNTQEINNSSKIVQTNLSSITLGGNDELKERIIDLLNEEVLSTVEYFDQKLNLMFSFKTRRIKITPDEMKHLADDVTQDIEDLEPNATIYPASFEFGSDGLVTMKIQVETPPVEATGVFKLKQRFPDVERHLVEIDMKNGLGTLRSKLEQILEYKLLTADRVNSGEEVYLTLPIKIKNESGHHYDVSLIPLIREILRSFDKVHFIRSKSKSLDAFWRLLKVEVRMPYSINKARYGLSAQQEPASQNRKRLPWFGGWLFGY